MVTSAQHEQHRPPATTPRLPAPDSRIPADLGWEPIRCWRQSTAGAVTIGEAFTVVLTCAVYEADNAQVVPDQSRLDVASIQLAPFEILGGSHPPDVRRGSRRFFQYDYRLRIISRDAIGQDVNIPPLPISYRIHSRVGAAASLEGRDLTYVMPMMPIKVLSLVPADADDIRDASEASLGAVESLRFRSSLFWVLTITFGALAAVMLVLALVPLTRSRAAGVTATREQVSASVALSRAVAELQDVQMQVSRGRWSEPEIERALRAMRLIAAVAIDRPFSQKPNIDGIPEGRLGTDRGLFRRRLFVISSSMTAADVARARDTKGLSATRRAQLEQLEGGLLTLTSVLYAKEPHLDSPALDEAIGAALSLAKDLAGERRWQGMPWAKR